MATFVKRTNSFLHYHAVYQSKLSTKNLSQSYSDCSRKLPKKWIFANKADLKNVIKMQQKFHFGKLQWPVIYLSEFDLYKLCLIFLKTSMMTSLGNFCSGTPEKNYISSIFVYYETYNYFEETPLCVCFCKWMSEIKNHSRELFEILAVIKHYKKMSVMK